MSTAGHEKEKGNGLFSNNDLQGVAKRAAAV
jgi:hypothetical protein